MNKIKSLFVDNKRFWYYALISVFITVIDVLLSYLLENVMDKFYANGIGVITGFIIQYILASKSVFNSRNMRSFIIFLLTFIVSLALAQGIILFSRDIIFGGADTGIAFLVSKGLSIAIPFFFTYFARNKLIYDKVADDEDDK